MDTYRGQEGDEWDVQKVISYKEVNGKVWYKVKQIGYKETTQEPEENLKNIEKKDKEYYKKVGQVKKRRKG